MRVPRILTIGGSDSSGGAGIQTDLKTIAWQGCYGMSALTALTAQNTQGVFAVEAVSPAIVREQVRRSIEDIGVDAIKVGMLHSQSIIRVVVEELRNLNSVPIIVDPVMVSTSGFRLLDEEAIEDLIHNLFPLATLITPNRMESECLVGFPLHTDEDVERAGKLLLSMASAVLIKGEGDDFLISSEGPLCLRQKKIETRNTHGTGCTLSSVIACFLARGACLQDAVVKGKCFLTRCLEEFKDVSLGMGKGPVLASGVISW